MVRTITRVLVPACPKRDAARSPIDRTPAERRSGEAIADHELERELAELHPAAHGWALACCQRRRAEAEDVLQAAYLKVLDGRAAFGGRSSFKTWLFGVIRQTAREHWRRDATRGRLLARWWRETFAASGAPSPEVHPDLAPDAGLDSTDEAERLLRALAELSPRQRDLLHLVFYQDLPLSEAASILGISPGTASTHYKRGKQRLREILEGASW